MKKIINTIAVCAIASSFLSGTVYAAKYSTGANDKEIKIGNTTAYTGPNAIYGVLQKTQQLYFKMINDNGGINGRKIVFISRDDAYNPGKTVPQIRRLVEKDRVLLLFNSIGTAHNLAVRDYLNQRKIPQLLIGSGYSGFNQPKKYPWTIPGVASYFTEGELLAAYILKNKPKAKIAVLYQNDDFGKDALAGLEKQLGDKSGMIVAKQSYEVTSPTVDSQIINLKASGADMAVLFTTVRATAQALKKISDIKWKAQTFIPAISTSKEFILDPVGFDKVQGVMSFGGLKDLEDPKYDNDPDVMEYKKFIDKYMENEDPNNFLFMASYSTSVVLKHILEQAGDNLTRENILKIASNLDYQLPLFIDGIHIKTTPDNYQAFNFGFPMFFEGESWKLTGKKVEI